MNITKITTILAISMAYNVRRIKDMNITKITTILAISMAMVQPAAFADSKEGCQRSNSTCAPYYAFVWNSLGDGHNEADTLGVYQLLLEAHGEIDSGSNSATSLVVELLQRGVAPSATKESVQSALRSMDKTQEGGICDDYNKDVEDHSSTSCFGQGRYCKKTESYVRVMSWDQVMEYLAYKINN